MMNLIESFFDVAYLGVVIAIGFRLLLEHNNNAKKYGVMALILGLGDAFHLIPRIIGNLTFDGFNKYVVFLSWGEFVTSITMTIFYVMFYHYYRSLSFDNSKWKFILIYILSIIRITFVLLPQNLWGTTGSYTFGILRNIPFLIIGLLLIEWCWKYKDVDGLKNTSILIAASFIFYIPVVFGVRFIPILGVLMMPKTIAYVLLIFTGFKYFIKDFKSTNLLKDAVVFLFLGLIAGVFYREFTKIFAYSNYTSLNVSHTHLISLGFIVILIIYLILEKEQNNIFYIKRPIIVYIIGISWMVVSFIVKGIYTIVSQGFPIFNNSALSGLAGVGHVITTVGIIWIFITVISIKSEKKSITK